MCFLLKRRVLFSKALDYLVFSFSPKEILLESDLINKGISQKIAKYIIKLDLKKEG
jgi:hypothetical protein